jgi:hypothetical protein
MAEIFDPEVKVSNRAEFVKQLGLLLEALSRIQEQMAKDQEVIERNNAETWALLAQMRSNWRYGLHMREPSEGQARLAYETQIQQERDEREREREFRQRELALLERERALQGRETELLRLENRQLRERLERLERLSLPTPPADQKSDVVSD